MTKSVSEKTFYLKFAKFYIWQLMTFFFKNKTSELTLKVFVFYTMILKYVIINLNL